MHYQKDELNEKLRQIEMALRSADEKLRKLADAALPHGHESLRKAMIKDTLREISDAHASTESLRQFIRAA